ncbi:MAG: type II toxin-antitoxin system HicB family antitoxin [Thermodesulfobacteriota bacterium]
MKVKVVVHKAEEGGYWGEVPSLPGCFTQGETLEELKRNLHEAVEGWLRVKEKNIEAGDKDTQVLELVI